MIAKLYKIAEGLITHRDVDEQPAEDELVVDEALLNLDVSSMDDTNP